MTVHTFRTQPSFVLVYLFITIITSLCISGSVLAADGSFGGGDGSVGAPWQIEDCLDLQAINGDSTAEYDLVVDIDCDGVSFSALNSFSGTLDGQGHTISNVTISAGSSAYQGLFSGIGMGGVVKNLGLVDITVTAGNYVGTLAGTSDGTVTQVYATGLVTCGVYCGGLIGVSGSVTSSYTNVVVTGNNYIGGVIGTSGPDAVLSDLYAIGSITGNVYVGGVIGAVGPGGISNSFYDSQTTGANDSGYGTGKTTAQMKTITTFIDENTAGLTDAWDFVGTSYDDGGVQSVWEMDPALNGGYPFLAWQNSDSNDPSAPTEFSADVSGSTATLSWTNPSDGDFSSLTLRRSTSAYPTAVSDGTAVTSSMVAESLVQNSLEDGIYYYGLFAYDNTGNISTVVTTTASIDTTAPAAPELAILVSNDDISLSWTLPVGAASVTIRRSISDFPTSTTAGTSVLSGSILTEYTDSDLDDGVYYYSIFAVDASANISSAGQASSTIDTTAPVISLLGSSSVSQNKGQTYTDAGATATDAIGGDLTDSINTSGSVNTSVPGTYIITYSVSDSADNAATSVTRTVTILPVGGGAPILPSGVGRGSSDRSIRMSETKHIGEITLEGINLLVYINTTALFRVSESSTGSLGEHSLTITDVDLSQNKEVTFVVASTPQTVSLKLGASADVDLDGDTLADLSVAFTALWSNRVELTVKAVPRVDKETTSVPHVSGTQVTTTDVESITLSCPNPLFVQEMKQGSQGPQVVALQQYLNSIGILVANSGPGSRGHETSYFGSLTEQALKEFQNHQSLTVTGVFDTSTRKALGCVTETNNVAVVVSTVFPRNLEMGMNGEDVRQLQIFLNANNFLVAHSGYGSVGKETTFFGALTEQAVIKFQTAKGILPANGYVGPLTRQAIMR